MNGNGSNDMFPQDFIDYMLAEAATPAPLPETCCGGTRNRIGCEYHDPALQQAVPAPESAAAAGMMPVSIGGEARWVSGDIAWPSSELRLLGSDDPEVSDDLIYATPTGGVVGVPQGAAALQSTIDRLILAAINADPFEGHLVGQHNVCLCNACKGRRYV